MLSLCEQVHGSFPKCQLLSNAQGLHKAREPGAPLQCPHPGQDERNLSCCQQLHCCPYVNTVVTERTPSLWVCLSAPCRTRLHSRTAGKHVLILQLHNGLHSPVVVVQVDCPHHFGPLQVPNLHCDLADGVTANELDDLLSGGVARIHFNGGQLDILNKSTGNNTVSVCPPYTVNVINTSSPHRQISTQCPPCVRLPSTVPGSNS